MIKVGNPTRRAMIKTGTYTGDGNDDRDIDIGVDLANKKNAYVIVKNTEKAVGPVHRIERGQGDEASFFTANISGSNQIQAFNTTGFQLGGNDNVNCNADLYIYIVFWQES